MFNCQSFPTLCCNCLSLFLLYSLSSSLVPHTLASLSDASLELCVMPKDEDILQLVSIHSSVNIASVLENAVYFLFIQKQIMHKTFSNYQF